jgi:PAS domain S-box-containing protein
MMGDIQPEDAVRLAEGRGILGATSVRDPLEMLAEGAPLSEVLSTLCLQIETLWPGASCSVLLTEAPPIGDPDRRPTLRFAAGPSLPRTYTDPLHGIRVGVGVGSCGTAVATGRRVVSIDLATDPFWKDFLPLAVAHNLASCWSSPIVAKDGAVLGTFAVYYAAPRAPSPEEIACIDHVTHIARVAIAAHQRERALSEAQSLATIAARMVRLGAWMIELATGVVTGTPELYEILDIPADAPIALDAILPRIDARYRAIIIGDLERCRAEGIPFDREIGLTTFAGKSVFVRASGAADRAENGEIVRLRGGFLDLTAQNAAGTELRLLQTAVENFHDIVILGENVDGKLRIVYVNPAFVASTGYSREEALASDDALLSGTLDGVGAALVAGALLARKPMRYSALPASKKGGEACLRDVDVLPLGDGHHWVALARDVTVRRANEARMAEQALLLDHARDAILVRDRNHRITYWNRGAEVLYGWAVEEALGRESRELLNRDARRFDEALVCLHRDGSWTGDLPQSTKSGREILVECHWTLVRDAHGEPANYISINADVTERRQLENQVLRSQRMESIGTLAGGIAHDLNNMLAPIVLSIGLLKETAPREDRDLFATMETSVRRSTAMVRQLLGFARGIDGTPQLLHPRMVIDEVLLLARDTFPKNILFRVNVAENVSTFRGDPTLLHQVLLNLCVNARDAMADGGTLTIEAYNHPAGEAQVVLAVSDTGTGISEEIRDRIFDPFFTTKPVGAGTGLGLPSVLGIAKSHGGNVEVHSEVGRGARFEVYLPTEKSSTFQSLATTSAAGPRGRGERILVVDDEPAVRAVTARTLEVFGYEVCLAASGVEALAFFSQPQSAQNSNIAAILTDMMMPRVDGIALARALRELAPGVPIIAASGLDTAERVAGAVAAGVRYFVPKPYGADTLLHTLRSALDGHSPATNE